MDGNPGDGSKQGTCDENHVCLNSGKCKDFRYVKSSLSSACCTSTGQIHRSCICTAKVSFCKRICDEDRNCKGYVEIATHKGANDTWIRCQIATSSQCPSENGCFAFGSSLGDLDKDKSCGQFYHGCFIKSLDQFRL